MNFKILKNGKEITCDIIISFKDKSNDINYVVYTDGTKDKDGDLEIYASRYIMNDDKVILNPIENKYEWNLIDNMLESKYKEIDKYE